MAVYFVKNKRSTERFRPAAPKLLDQMREVMRYHHDGKRTEDAYVRWIHGARSNKPYSYLLLPDHPE